MTLSEPRDVGEFYQTEANKELAKLLTDIFHDVTMGLVSEIDMTHPYVGLKHFRNNVLAPALAQRLSQLSANLILNELIHRGDLEVYQMAVEGSEYPVAAIRKSITTDNDLLQSTNTEGTTTI